MSRERRDVRFIRKGGRIIPIRQRRRSATGPLVAGVGIGLAGAAGTAALAGRQSKAMAEARSLAESYEKRKSTQGGLFKTSYTPKRTKTGRITKKSKTVMAQRAKQEWTAKRLEAKHRARHSVLKTRRRALFAASATASSYLLGKGAERLYLGAGGPERYEMPVGLAATGVGLAGHAAVYHKFATGRPIRKTLGRSLGGARDVAKGLGREAVEKATGIDISKIQLGTPKGAKRLLGKFAKRKFKIGR